jgi:hypothetical protein
MSMVLISCISQTVICVINITSCGFVCQFLFVFTSNCV